MDGNQFKAIVAKQGEDKLIAIVFDNTARSTFKRGEFSLATHFDDEIECLIFKNADGKDNGYTNVRHIENVQSLVFIDDVEKWDYIDKRLIAQ